MSEEANQVVDDSASKSGGGGAKKWVSILVLLIIIIAAQIGIAVFVFKKMVPADPAEKALAEEKQSEEEKHAERTSMGATLKEPIEVIVNIAGTNGERYLKAGVQLEWDAANAHMAHEVETRLPKIKDIIIGVLSSKSLDELQSPDGKENLRNAIVADINSIMPVSEEEEHPSHIRACYFNEFIIQ